MKFIIVMLIAVIAEFCNKFLRERDAVIFRADGNDGNIEDEAFHAEGGFVVDVILRACSPWSIPNSIDKVAKCVPSICKLRAYSLIVFQNAHINPWYLYIVDVSDCLHIVEASYCGMLICDPFIMCKYVCLTCSSISSSRSSNI